MLTVKYDGASVQVWGDLYRIKDTLRKKNIILSFNATPYHTTIASGLFNIDCQCCI